MPCRTMYTVAKHGEYCTYTRSHLHRSIAKLESIAAWLTGEFHAHTSIGLPLQFMRTKKLVAGGPRAMQAFVL